jgi:hypothetical protein
VACVEAESGVAGLSVRCVAGRRAEGGFPGPVDVGLGDPRFSAFDAAEHIVECRGAAESPDTTAAMVELPVDRSAFHHDAAAQSVGQRLYVVPTAYLGEKFMPGVLDRWRQQSQRRVRAASGSSGNPSTRQQYGLRESVANTSRRSAP